MAKERLSEGLSSILPGTVLMRKYSIDVEDEAGQFLDELSDIFGFMFQTLVLDPRSKISVKYEILTSNKDVEVDYIEYNQLE